MITVMAQAKLNLTLEVLGKRDDGYHEIKSVVQTMRLCDNLKFSAGQGIEIKCNLLGWNAYESLVYKSVGLLRKKTDKGALIEIEKRIPMIAGLGGDSSDAAAALRGLNMLWGLGLSLRGLSDLSAELGSDVPLFIHGGTLLLEGRGEKVAALPPLPHIFAVILVPPLPKPEKKTERLYSLLNKADYTSGHITDEFVSWLNKPKQTFPALYNAFDYVAMDFFEGLKDYRQKFLECGAAEVHLCGSGPALFTLTKDSDYADKICCNLQEKGIEHYLTEF